MCWICRMMLGVGTILLIANLALGQDIRFDDPPKVIKPAPPTRRELDRRESLYKYTQGVQLERAEKLDEALKAFEGAARLDPDAAAPVKAQVPILLTMSRLDDALAACKKVIALDPGDFGTLYVQAKIHKASLQYPQAITVLQSAIKTETLKDHPEASQAIYFELGGLYERTDKFGPAADAYNHAAAILEHPDQIEAKAHVPRAAILARAADAYDKIGQLYRKAKRYDDAIAAYKKAAERAPDRATLLHYVMAQTAQEAGNLPQALGFVDVYLRTRPLGVEPYEMKADLLRRTKQAQTIVPWLEDAAGRDQFNSSLQALLAREYAAAGQAKKAETLFTKLIDESPNDELYRGLFNLYKQQGPAGMQRMLTMFDKAMDRNEAVQSVRTVQQARAMLGALREDGDLACRLVDIAFRSKQELKFDTIFYLAILADKHRKNEEAERFYRKCMSDPKTLQANEAILYSGLLRVLSKLHKNESIVTVCQQGLQNAKATNPLLFYNDLARALASLHRYDDALKQVNQALKQPGNSELVFKMLRVRILSMAERYAEAEAECKTMLKDNSRVGEVVEVRYLLSNVYSAAKRSADSEAQLQLILKVDPDNATVNNDLGYLWADQGKNLAAAETLIRKALDADRVQRRKSAKLSADDDKDNAAYVDSLGWVLFRRGQVEEARKELERAASLDEGGDPVIYDHLGDVYRRLNLRPEATRCWQRALELYNNGVRGKDDERIRDIRRKIDQAKEQVGGR
ncbi:MAG TPA: tetratricopeptide repeat protein [Gemmataceae bacterium]|nr:tetratricopeptide repeat protein [Gemmataceae bacterium]